MKKKLSLICASLICSASTVTHADTTAYLDVLFDWAETELPAVFPTPPAAAKGEIINKIESSDQLALGVSEGAALLTIVNKITSGEAVTEADLSPALKDLNDRKESWVYRGYDNGIFIGGGTKPLTPAFSEVRTFNTSTGELSESFGSIEALMTLVPAATSGGTEGCVDVPSITKGTKVTYSIDSKSTTDLAVDQKQVATYSEVTDSKVMIDIVDESFGESPSTQNMTIIQEITTADGWRSLNKNTLAFNDPEVAGTFTDVANDKGKLLGPAGKYCTDHTWTSNAVNQTISGKAVVTENGTPTSNDVPATQTIDKIVHKGKVMSTSTEVIIGDKTYDTVKVSITNVLNDLTSLIWYDKATGVDVKESVVDDRDDQKEITVTTVTSIEAP